MDLSYDRERTAEAYDAYGEKEWVRHEATPFNRVSFVIHRHYVQRFIRPGDRVLEAGAASGRFTVELAALWDRLLAWEIRSCAQPGAIDAGTHIIAVVRRRSNVAEGSDR